jgi:transposase
MSKQTMTKSQLREAINGLGPLAPDWLVEALEDFIELQEAHKNLLAIHAEDAYHLDEARAKLEAQQPASVPDEIESELSEIEYKAGYVFKDCHETAHQAIDYMMVQFRAMLKGEK